MNTIPGSGRVVNTVQEIPAKLEESLCQFIRETTGLVLQDHQLPNLRQTVVKACEKFGLTTAQDFYERLCRSEQGSAEMEYLVAGVTVGESYFFREEEQVRLLRQQFLPQLITRKRASQDRSLRIWSAGCSHGQEAYTLAMILTDLIPDIDDWNIQLMGTDINVESLAKAVRGQYTEWSFRATDDDTRARFFRREGNFHVVNEQIRSMCHFSYLNLVEDCFPSTLTQTHAIDLLLCRNVFIYFDQHTSDRLTNKFSQCLAPGGCMLLSASDRLMSTIASLDTCLFGHTQYYMRPDRLVPAVSVPVVHEPLYDILIIEDASLPVDAGNTISNDVPLPVVEQAKAVPEAIYNLIRAARWEDVKSALDVHVQRYGESARSHQLRAKALANLGELKDALQACERCIEQDPLDPHSYFIKGMVLMELNNLDAAEAAYRHTLFLQSDFLEAHFQLGLLLLRRQCFKSGLKSMRNALKLAQAQDPQCEAHEATGMSFGRLVEILKQEIEMYQDMDEGNNHASR